MLRTLIFIALLFDLYIAFTYDGSSRRPQIISSVLEPLCDLKNNNPKNVSSKRILQCHCKEMKELHLGHQTPSARKVFVRYFQNQANGLEIRKCEKVFLYSDFQWLSQNFKVSPIEYLRIENVGNLYLAGTLVFDFSFLKNVSVHIILSNIRNPMVFPSIHGTFPVFGGPIRLVHFHSLEWLDFNTNNFMDLSSSRPHVKMTNCTLKTMDPGSSSFRIFLSKLSISNGSKIVGAGHGTLNVSLNHFLLEDSKVELISEKSFDIESRKAKFRNVTLGLQAKSLRIFAEDILFNNVTFNQPKSMSLIELHSNGTGFLRFDKICLIDPSRGTLVFGSFFSIQFKNVTISNCICDLHTYLLDSTQSVFSLRMLPGVEEELKRSLKNNTRCFDQHKKVVREIRECDSGTLDAVYISIVLILFMGIFGIISTILTVYLLNKRNRDQRIRLIQDWSVALPRPKSYRETTVKFDLQSVQSFSGPSSVSYIEQKNEPDLVHGLESKEDFFKEISLSDEDEETEDIDDRKIEIENSRGRREFNAPLSVIIEEDDLQNTEDFVQEF